jgi:hypothetical protein
LIITVRFPRSALFIIPRAFVSKTVASGNIKHFC